MAEIYHILQTGSPEIPLSSSIMGFSRARTTSCSCVPSNDRRDIANGQWKQGMKERAWGQPGYGGPESAGRMENPSQDPQRGWPAGFSLFTALLTSSMTSTVMADKLGCRNDILSQEILSKYKEGKTASKEQVTSIYNTFTIGPGQ